MDRLPVEILLRIYEHCDQFRQATSLSSVNKRWRSMWEDKMPTILWHVGTASVVGFNDALMAARATTIVKEQIQAGKLPPHPFPLPSLRDPKVSLDELMAVFDLQHLAECLEYKQCHQTDWATDNDLTVDAIWRERFRQSLYRVFLAAAALTGAYQEPFLKQTDDCPKSFVKGYKDELIEEDPDVQNFAEVLTPQDFRYLLQFPVYNFQDYERHDDTYGRLAEFLFQLSQERACHEGMEDNALDRLLSDHSPEARVLFHETSQLLVAFECLQENTVRSELGHDAMGGTGRKALIVSLGSFFPVEFDLPLCSANVDPTGLAYKNITVDKPPEVHYLGPLDILLDLVFRESGQPNYYDTTCPAPAPPLQFFEYMYRKYLGLRFSKSAFEESKYAPYPRWVSDANVFFDSFRMWSDSFDGALVADTPLPAFYRR